MPIRMTDTEIWEEDWFIDLPNEYKLFYLFIKDKCDHSGMWRPNRRKFTMSVHGSMLHYEEFLKKVNYDPEKQEVKNRIIILDNGKWFLTRFISFQLGGKYYGKIGAHRGALKLLITNGIHPKDVPNMDWSGLESIEMKELRELAYGKGLYALSIGEGKGKHREIEKEQYPEQDSIGKGVAGEKPKPNIFKMQHWYDLAWGSIDSHLLSKKEFRDVQEVDFQLWKKFVDWVIEHDYTDLFRTIFPHPADFKSLVHKNGFTADKWEPVVKKLFSSGVKPEHNLYFRIPDFMKYARVNNAGGVSGMDSGSNDQQYDNMQKW